MEAVRYDADGCPLLELAATELIFPITVEQGGQEFVALFHMSPYLPRELDDTLRASGFRSRKSRGWFRNEAAPTAPLISFFDRHFIRMSGVEGEPSLETQKAFLERKPQLKRAVFTGGYGGVRSIEARQNGHSGLLISLEEDNRISVDVPLWSAERSRAELIRAVHHLRRLAQGRRRHLHHLQRHHHLRRHSHPSRLRRYHLVQPNHQ